MNMDELMAKIEAVLFSLGSAVSLAVLVNVIGSDEDTVKVALKKLMEKYDSDDHGIKIIELDGSYKMCAKREMYETLIKVVHAPKKQELTDSLLETLSIVAYRQPVTRSDVEAIRGVNSDHSINKLVEYGLIEEAGRLQAPGRPIVFGTTEKFLTTFDITSLSDLPVISEEQESTMKAEALNEAKLSFGFEDEDFPAGEGTEDENSAESDEEVSRLSKSDEKLEN